jgi:hypothetical protein
VPVTTNTAPNTIACNVLNRATLTSARHHQAEIRLPPKTLADLFNT